jgi:hypothetical protein
MMPEPYDGAIYKLASDENPMFVAVDFGSDGAATECEIEVLPDGSIYIADIRTIEKSDDQ